MDKDMQEAITKRYKAAVDSFVSKVKDGPNVIAVIVCGSLAYDQVWEKSDIDMTLVVRDMNLKNDAYCIDEDGININMYVVTRTSIKRQMERQFGGSFMQAYYAKGVVVYCKDESFIEYFEEMKSIGSDDMALCIFYSACELVYYYEKSLKWLTVKNDTVYAQYYLLKAAEVMARMVVCMNGEPPTREAIRRALEINPGLLRPYYTDAMSRLYGYDEVKKAIEGIYAYLQGCIPIISRPLIEYMQDGELKTVTLLARHFNTDSIFMISILDFLAEEGVIARVSQTIRLTPKSRKAVEEIGYIYNNISM